MREKCGFGITSGEEECLIVQNIFGSIFYLLKIWYIKMLLKLN